MRVVFLCEKHYFKNVNTNVSNARTNIPKAIRSLKSNGFLSISTTANSHFLRTAGPHFPDSPGHIKRTAWDISRAEGTPPY